MGVAPSDSVRETLDRHAGTAEAQQGAKWKTGRYQIVQALGIVNRIQRYNSLQLDQNCALNQ